MSDQPFQQLGKFIYNFQLVETLIKDLIELIANSDDEMIRILMNELSFSQKVKTVNVMFSRLIDVKNNTIESDKSDFHKLMSKILKLAERRNDLVHSRYYSYLSQEHEIGLLRKNSKLRGKSGVREETEEVLFSVNFNDDFEKLSEVINHLEQFRLKIIDLV
ncbi:hypothetical protein [Lacimicrobium sp. SS2-24]|uniref:hypothetical protein n=1 Tax=Lacimicrobium sp. SS2-24 TaxID=2005569 RepID=UPI000B4B98A8|nr:hypothetical protein [Lacimicrobium sp. SS2-24]